MVQKKNSQADELFNGTLPTDNPFYLQAILNKKQRDDLLNIRNFHTNLVDYSAPKDQVNSQNSPDLKPPEKFPAKNNKESSEKHFGCKNKQFSSSLKSGRRKSSEKQKDQSDKIDLFKIQPKDALASGEKFRTWPVKNETTNKQPLSKLIFNDLNQLGDKNTLTINSDSSSQNDNKPNISRSQSFDSTNQFALKKSLDHNSMECLSISINENEPNASLLIDQIEDVHFKKDANKEEVLDEFINPVDKQIGIFFFIKTAFKNF